MTVTKKNTKTATKTTLPAIYLGPTIPKSGLQNGVILTKGIPNDAKEHAKNCPEIEKMVVSADLAADARVNINKIGTPEHKFFEKIATYVGGLK